MIRVLGLCGSLRTTSKNRLALEIARDAAPEGVQVRLWNGHGGLPPFSPDLDQPGLPLPPAVADFHGEIAAAEALLIACPEYAHGIPGAFKNALDWLVGSTSFPGKSVALVNVAPHASHAQAQLREVLATMSAVIVEDACQSLTFQELQEHEGARRLREALDRLADHSMMFRDGQSIA